jgi:hypothetical protein
VVFSEGFVGLYVFMRLDRLFKFECSVDDGLEQPPLKELEDLRFFR